MKIWKLMLTVALIATVVLVLASCGCEHIYDEAISKAPTCTEKGEKTLTCSQCGNVRTEAIEAKGHTYTEKATSLLDYVKTLDGVAPYSRGESLTSGMIQNGKWYNTSFDQVFIDEDLGLRSMEVFTVSFDCQLGLEFTQGVRDQIFGWCSYATDVALSDRFTIQLGQDNKLHYLINYKDSAKNTEKLAGYTFEDRTAWYHFDFTVNTVDQTVTVAFGIWTDESFTTLTGYQVLGVATGFQNQGATRVEDAFRFSRNQGVVAMDNFIVSVPVAK